LLSQKRGNSYSLLNGAPVYNHPQNHSISFYEVEVLSQLSVGNVRELLRAALPLPQLSPEEAA
jgi:hypothetical protein